MSTDLKYSNDMKEQAIAHWEDNLKRVKAISWKEWKGANSTARRTIVFSTVGDKLPHIGGNACPYCIHYHWQCRAADGDLCPLKQEPVSGGCCVAWLNVREALITPWSRAQTVTAIKAMIEYIKEKG